MQGSPATLKGIHTPYDALADFSRRNHIRRLAVFGSALRDDFQPDSDLDILVEFEPGARVGLRFFALERELTELFGRPVDLNTPGFLSPYFREEVIAEAQDLYVAP
jgi:predicted nucleotidyltransferase